MPASTGIVGLGTKLQAGDGASPEVFSDIANVESIDMAWVREVIDATHLGSPGGYREKRGHLKDAGPLTATVQFDATHATHDDATGLLNLFEDGTLTNFRLDFSDADGGNDPWATNNLFSFTGFVTNLGLTVPVDGLIEASLEITITGPVTVGDAA